MSDLSEPQMGELPPREPAFSGALTEALEYLKGKRRLCEELIKEFQHQSAELSGVPTGQALTGLDVVEILNRFLEKELPPRVEAIVKQVLAERPE